MTLLTIDPGLRGCGVAWFQDDVLVRCAYVKNSEKTARGPKAWRKMGEAVLQWLDLPQVDVLVVEVPQVYVRGKGDPADLIELAGVDGAIAALVDGKKTEGYWPKEWKGSVPKDVYQKRFDKTLTPEERVMLKESATASLRHNVIDAVAIGKWWIKKNRSVI
jgi:hypothetical protein